MKNERLSQLYYKYASEVIIPPAPEEIEEISIKPEKENKRLTKLLRDDLDKVWEDTVIKDSIEDLIKDVPENDFDAGSTSESDVKTVPPPRKQAQLLYLCASYANYCRIYQK
jgi:hypothetical protein